MSMIEMKDVVKKYDNGTTALRGVTVSIEPGKVSRGRLVRPGLVGT